MQIGLKQNRELYIQFILKERLEKSNPTFPPGKAVISNIIHIYYKVLIVSL